MKMVGKSSKHTFNHGDYMHGNKGPTKSPNQDTNPRNYVYIIYIYICIMYNIINLLYNIYIYRSGCFPPITKALEGSIGILY